MAKEKNCCAPIRILQHRLSLISGSIGLTRRLLVKRNMPTGPLTIQSSNKCQTIVQTRSGELHWHALRCVQRKLTVSLAFKCPSHVLTVTHPSISSFLKSQPMRWTSHMEDCLRHLANEAETPGDELLVSIVQIQKVMDVVTALTYERLFESEAHGPPKVPSISHIKALRSNLEAVEKGFRPELSENSAYSPFLIGNCR